MVVVGSACQLERLLDELAHVAAAPRFNRGKGTLDHLVDRRASVESPRDGGRDGGGAVLAEGDVGHMNEACEFHRLRGGGFRMARIDDAYGRDGHR